MSSLYKRKDSPYWWWESIYKSRRFAQSTKMTNKKLAKKVKEHWDFNLILGNLDFLNRSIHPSPLIEDYMSKYLIFVENRKAEKAVYAAKCILYRFRDFMFSQNVKRLDQINVSLLDDYIDSIKKKVKAENGKDYKEISVAPKTKKNHLQEISLMLDQAVKEDVIQSNPATKATLPKMIKQRENRVLAPIDLEIIFESAGGWSLYYAFLYHTGLRAGDVALLKYGNIDIKKKAITSFVRKSRKKQEFPIAKVLINQLPKGMSEDTPIFPDVYADTERKLTDNLAKPRKFMQKLLKANNRPHATLHSFRHTFNNSLRDLGLSIEDRQVLLAHASSDVNKIYTHPNFDLASQYVNKLPTYNGKRSNNA